MSSVRRGMTVGALIGAVLGCAAFFLFETSLSHPPGCDGLMMGAIHCIFLPVIGLIVAVLGGAMVGAPLGAVVAAIRGY